MELIDNLLTYNKIENKSIVIGFIKEDEKVLNENLRNIIFDDSLSYSKFLRSNKPSVFNKYIRIDNDNDNKYYYIFLESNEEKLEKYKYFADLLFIDMYELYEMKGIKTIHTYLDFLNNEKKEILLNNLKFFDDKIDIKLYTNDIT